MKTLKYILNAILGILILIFFEGMMTLGQAFSFEQYSWFGYFIQILLVLAAIIMSIFITYEDIKKNN